MGSSMSSDDKERFLAFIPPARDLNLDLLFSLCWTTALHQTTLRTPTGPSPEPPTALDNATPPLSTSLLVMTAPPAAAPETEGVGLGPDGEKIVDPSYCEFWRATSLAELSAGAARQTAR